MIEDCTNLVKKEKDDEDFQESAPTSLPLDLFLLEKALLLLRATSFVIGSYAVAVVK